MNCNDGSCHERSLRSGIRCKPAVRLVASTGRSNAGAGKDEGVPVVVDGCCRPAASRATGTDTMVAVDTEQPNTEPPDTNAQITER